MATALTISTAERPCAWRAEESVSTDTRRCLPPYGNGVAAPWIVASCVRIKLLPKSKRLLLAQRVAGEAELDDGHGGSGIDNDERRSSAGRQEAEKKLGNGRPMRESRLNIRVRLEIDFDHGDARQRLPIRYVRRR